MTRLWLLVGLTMAALVAAPTAILASAHQDPRGPQRITSGLRRQAATSRPLVSPANTKGTSRPTNSFATPTSSQTRATKASRRRTHHRKKRSTTRKKHVNRHHRIRHSQRRSHRRHRRGAPSNATRPVITGTPQQGDTLSTSNGSWSNTPSSYAYQWQDCSTTQCTNISGATSSTYTLQSGDVASKIDAIVTASNTGGSTSATSPQVGPVSSASSGGSGGSSSGGSGSGGGGPFSEGHWPAGNWAPYASTSPWNQQLPIYTSAVSDPNSATIINTMNGWGSNWSTVALSNTPSQDGPSNWSHPLYWASSSDPTYTISGSCYQPPVATSCPTTVQIPNGAQHALGSDGHLAVIQPDGHTEVDFWQVHNANPISGGGTISASAYGALDLNGSGCCGASTAANQGLPAGLIGGQEMATGAIHHALSIVVRCTNGSYVAPATGAAAGGCSSGPADGQRLQLKMTDAQIAASSYPQWEKIILTAMANYGVIVTDTGDNNAGYLLFQPAIQYTSFGNTSNTPMSYMATQGFSDPANINISLSWSNFQVVSPSHYG